MPTLANILRVTAPARSLPQRLRESRFMLAVLVAPLVPAVIIGTQRIWAEDTLGGALSPSISLWILAGYIGLYVMGLPGLRFLYRADQLSIPTASLLGFLSGIAVAGSVWAFLSVTLDIQVLDLAGVLRGGWLGVSVTLVFVLIAGVPPRSDAPVKGERRGSEPDAPAPIAN